MGRMCRPHLRVERAQAEMKVILSIKMMTLGPTQHCPEVWELRMTQSWGQRPPPRSCRAALACDRVLKGAFFLAQFQTTEIQNWAENF